MHLEYLLSCHCTPTSRLIKRNFFYIIMVHRFISVHTVLQGKKVNLDILGSFAMIMTVQLIPRCLIQSSPNLKNSDFMISFE